MKAVILESEDQTSDQAPDLLEVIAGMTYIYDRPWFGRIWIQQEIFAARKLVFQCGDLSFEWPLLWSDPEKLTTLPSFQGHPSINRLPVPSLRAQQNCMSAQDRTMDEQEAQAIQVKTDALSTLVQLHRQNLHCFERFSHPAVAQMDFIETLLDTSSLGATNPRDHIYGILGITDFPAKPMTMKNWITARQYDAFLPIDYSADMTSLLCAVSWTMLMKGGLTVLAKFKAFHLKTETCQPTLPSWVIDWWLAGALFRKKILLPVGDHKIGAAGSEISETERDDHHQFCKDNSQLLPLTQINVRGVVDPRFYAKEKGVWSMEKKNTMNDKAIWNLEVDVFSTDLIVQMHDFQCCSFFLEWQLNDGTHWCSKYSSWLIRPTDHGQFKLIACLVGMRIVDPLFDNVSMWHAKNERQLSDQQLLLEQYRIFSVIQARRISLISHPEFLDYGETRSFTIV